MDSRPSRTERKWIYEVGYAALVVVAAVIVLSPFSGAPDGPSTAERPALFSWCKSTPHIFATSTSFRCGRAATGLGMGSPVLLYYQRTFFYVAGFIYALFGGLKFSVVITIAIFLAIGAYGMRRALRVVTDSRLLYTAGSLGFLFTNYAFTDWLDPHGDLGEFAAFMIVPWLLYWCLNLVRTTRFVHRDTGHGAVGQYPQCDRASLAVHGVHSLSYVRHLRRAPRSPVYRRETDASVAGTALLLAPLLLADLLFFKSYDPQTKNTLFGFDIWQENSIYSDRTSTTAPVTGLLATIRISCRSISRSGCPSRLPWLRYSHSESYDYRKRQRLTLPRHIDDPLVIYLLVSLAVYLFTNCGSPTTSTGSCPPCWSPIFLGECLRSSFPSGSFSSRSSPMNLWLDIQTELFGGLW